MKPRPPRAPQAGAALNLALLAALALTGCAGRGKIKNVGPRPIVVSTPTTEPAPEAPVAAAPAVRRVTVAKGESLWRISRRELGRGARWPELAQGNALREPWIIQPGQALQLTGTAAAYTGVKPTPSPTPPPRNEARRYGWLKRDNRAFTVGEKLTFAVQYGNVTAGYATLTINEVLEKSGRPAYHIVAEARTHPFFETFFKVRDRIESYIDTDYVFSWGYEKHIREGGHEADASYIYDQRAGMIREPDKGKDQPMPIGAQDVLSCFYFFRTMDMTEGSVQTIQVTADDMKSYDLSVNVLKRETVQTLAGSFDCVKVQPHLQFQGVFQQKGEVFIWLTDDVRRIPVMIRSKIKIGAININLQDAEWAQPQ
jgi:hypothetical protein